MYIEGGKIEKRVFQSPSAARPQRPALIGRDSHPLLSAASCTRSRFSLIYSVPAVKLCVWWELPQWEAALLLLLLPPQILPFFLNKKKKKIIIILNKNTFLYCLPSVWRRHAGHSVLWGSSAYAAPGSSTGAECGSAWRPGEAIESGQEETDPAEHRWAARIYRTAHAYMCT